MDDPVQDRKLTDYLLGSLPEVEAERFDELSVADDAFAIRLEDAENDLLDAYAHEELDAELSTRFRSHYLSTPYRRERARMAHILQRAGSRLGRITEEKRPAVSIVGGNGSTTTSPSWWKSLFGSQRGLMAAAILLLAISSVLAVNNWRLRRDNEQLQESFRSVQEQKHQLETQADRAFSGNPAQEPKATTKPFAAGNAEEKSGRLIALLLAPAMRGAQRVPDVSISGRTERLELRLQLEGDDYPRYGIAIKDLATNRIEWRSSALTSGAVGESRGVIAHPEVEWISGRHYAAELIGLPRSGTKEAISSYEFRIMNR